MRDLVQYMDTACKKRVEAAEQIAVQRKHRRLGVWHLALSWMSAPPQPLDVGTLYGACDMALDTLGRILPPERPVTPKPWEAGLEALVRRAAARAASFSSKTITEAILFWSCCVDETIGPAMVRCGAKDDVRVEVERAFVRARSVPSACLGLPGAVNLTTEPLPCEVLGRESELDRICTILLRDSQRVAVVCGPSGAGRTTLLRALGAHLMTERAPSILGGLPLMLVQAHELCDGGSSSLFWRGASSVELATKSAEVIIALDGLEHLAGQWEEHLAKALRPLLDARAGIVITTTPEAWTSASSKLSRLAAVSSVVQLAPIKDADAQRVAHTYAAAKAKRHAIALDPEAASLAVTLSSRYLKQPQPLAAKLALDEAVAGHVAGGLQERLGASHIAAAVSRIAGVPVSSGRTQADQRVRLRGLDAVLSVAVLSQPRAVEAVARAVRLGAMGMADPRRPIGSFLFVGPTGVGKTELAKALARELFDSEKAMIRLDMSEYQESHKVSTLIGSPLGYMDSDKGGILTEAVKRMPNAVVLFDEIEKGHPKVLDLLLQVLDDGRLSDSRGQEVSFTGCVVILTSNLGASALGESSLEGDELESLARDCLVRGGLRQEFIGRFGEVVVFRPLDFAAVRAILDREVSTLAKLVEAQGVTLHVTDEAREKLARDGFDPRFGARPLRRAVERGLKEAYAQAALARDEGFVRGCVVEARLGSSGRVEVVEVQP